MDKGIRDLGVVQGGCGNISVPFLPSLEEKEEEVFLGIHEEWVLGADDGNVVRLIWPGNKPPPVA